MNSCRGGGQRRAEDGVGAEAPLVWRAVELDQRLIEAFLIQDVETAQPLGNLTRDVAYGIRHALAAIPLEVAVAELHGLVDPSGCP